MTVNSRQICYQLLQALNVALVKVSLEVMVGLSKVLGQVSPTSSQGTYKVTRSGSELITATNNVTALMWNKSTVVCNTSWRDSSEIDWKIGSNAALKLMVCTIFYSLKNYDNSTKS